MEKQVQFSITHLLPTHQSTTQHHVNAINIFESFSHIFLSFFFLCVCKVLISDFQLAAFQKKKSRTKKTNVTKGAGDACSQQNGGEISPLEVSSPSDVYSVTDVRYSFFLSWLFYIQGIIYLADSNWVFILVETEIFGFKIFFFSLVLAW